MENRSNSPLISKTFGSELLKRVKKNTAKKAHCFIGFDGFTDELLSAVKERKSAKQFIPFKTILSFGKRIVDAAGKSANIELIVKQKKIGGNAPILAQALVEGRHLITLAAMVGDQSIEPLFTPLTSKCHEVILLGPSGFSDALEFNDGKLIFGRLASLQSLTAKEVIKRIGKKRFCDLLDRSSLFISANWTMLMMMNDLWAYIVKEIAPKLSQRKRYLFVDLADPAKRTDKDFKKALMLLKKLSKTFHVIQGLNLSEAERLMHVLSLPKMKINKSNSEKAAALIRKKTGFSQVIIHTKDFATSAIENGVFTIPGFYTPSPKITTGAGDNFNAGFCNALLLGFDTPHCLLSGLATGSFYVRHAKSPTMEELAFFLRNWVK